MQILPSFPANARVFELHAGCRGHSFREDPVSEQELGIADKLTQPLRVVVDSRLLMKPSARMLDQGGNTLVATIDAKEQRDNSNALIDAGAEIVFLPERDGHVDLHALG